MNQKLGRIRGRHPLNLESGDIQLIKIKANTDLHKVTGHDKYDPIKKQFEPLSHEDWAGQYFAFDPKVAEGYGSDYFNEKTLKSEYYRNKLRVMRDIYAVEITNKNYADSNVIQDFKANKIKWFLSNRGLGRYADQNDKKSISKDEFKRFSNELKKTFANKNMMLMNGLDKSHLALKQPHDNEDNKELILHSNTLGNLYIPKKPIAVVDDGRDVTVLSKKKPKKPKISPNLENK